MLKINKTNTRVETFEGNSQETCYSGSATSFDIIKDFNKLTRWTSHSSEARCFNLCVVNCIDRRIFRWICLLSCWWFIKFQLVTSNAPWQEFKHLEYWAGALLRSWMTILRKRWFAIWTTLSTHQKKCDFCLLLRQATQLFGELISTESLKREDQPSQSLSALKRQKHRSLQHKYWNSGKDQLVASINISERRAFLSARSSKGQRFKKKRKIYFQLLFNCLSFQSLKAMTQLALGKNDFNLGSKNWDFNLLWSDMKFILNYYINAVTPVDSSKKQTVYSFHWSYLIITEKTKQWICLHWSHIWYGG